MSLLTEGSAENNPTQGLQNEQSSFLDRKRAELAAESDSTGTTDASYSESAEDAATRRVPVQHEEDEYEEPEASADAEDKDAESDLIDDETTEDVDPEAEGDTDWEKQYKELQPQFTKLAQERAQEREESARSVEQNIRLRHSLEENAQLLEKHGQFLFNMIRQPVARFEQLDWDNMPVEQKAQKRGEYQMALNSANQMQNAMKQISEQSRMVAEQAKQKEAEVSKEVLKRTIPNWGAELYGQLRDHAIQHIGYTAEEVDRITDHRMIRMIHKNWENEQALAKVQEVKRQGKKRPPKRGAKPQERNAQGRFDNSRRNFRQGKGSFQEMTTQRLKNERGGR